ncbi:hypothetical protein PILCRDRAFT_130795 [Piloderma croceum F 1598]|uniref:Uncharacterized protein n=1 Tax=Piloderma croceum (strain F 1598) TaxID=765440 RepID=A0A0C3G5E7_PILCF|nr:hypothetical protein PILCRDRAFT_130795 [Piloderma croceum F 1598]
MDARTSIKRCYGPLGVNNFDTLHLDDTPIRRAVTRLDSNNYRAAQRKLPFKYALAIKVANNEAGNPRSKNHESQVLCSISGPT